jgi:putative redox protein
MVPVRGLYSRTFPYFYHKLPGMKTTTYWKSGLSFESHFKNNQLSMDDASTSGRDDGGFSPKALLLSGLAGCTGMDVVSILDKMKAPYDSIRIEVEAEQTEDHPRVFREIIMIYYVKIPASYEDKVKRAVELSLDKYCGVAAMLRKHCPIYNKVIIE